MRFTDKHGNEISEFQVEYDDGKTEDFTLEKIFGKVKELNAESADRRRSLAALKQEYALMGDINPKDVPRLMSELEASKQANTALQGQIDETAMLEAFRVDKTLAGTIYLPEHAVKIFGDSFQVKDGQVVSKDMTSKSGQPLPLAEAMPQIIDNDPLSAAYMKIGSSGGGAFGGSTHAPPSQNMANAIESGNLSDYRKAKVG